jgi:hypothetical protein
VRTVPFRRKQKRALIGINAKNLSKMAINYEFQRT